MTDITVVQRMMDRILAEDLERALDWMARDIELTALPVEPSSEAQEVLRGRRAVGDYFGALGGIVTFWQVRYIADGDEVLVPVRECYVTNSGLQSDSEFLLVCEVRNGQVARILVAEDLITTLSQRAEYAEAPLRPTVYCEEIELDKAMTTALSSAVEEIALPEAWRWNCRDADARSWTPTSAGASAPYTRRTSEWRELVNAVGLD